MEDLVWLSELQKWLVFVNVINEKIILGCMWLFNYLDVLVDDKKYCISRLQYLGSNLCPQLLNS